MLKPAVNFLRFLFGVGSELLDPDGFGQSAADDARFARRFGRARRIAVVWRAATDEEASSIDDHPIIGRFGGQTIGVADVEGRRWIVRERDWHGWPDPPRFVFFALEDDTIWAGADFDWWPRAWQWRPDDNRPI